MQFIETMRPHHLEVLAKIHLSPVRGRKLPRFAKALDSFRTEVTKERTNCAIGDDWLAGRKTVSRSNSPQTVLQRDFTDVE